MGLKDREARRKPVSNMIVSKDYFNLKGKNAEKVVHELALKTFLTDWCYLNPLLPSGRELCDLLVVFDEVAIIWQIKDLKLDTYGRHNKSEIEKNLRQLSGARRVLFDLKTPVELQNPRRTKKLLDPATIKEVYLVSVLLGQAEEEFNFVESIRNHTVHVFAGDFTQIVLDELDTIADFAAYLREKETFLAQDRNINILGGEEDLLGCYLANNRSFATLSEGDYIILDQGFWSRVQSSQEYKAKKKEDEISYIWDNIINRVHEGSAKYEIVARELARPNRFHRRHLSKVYADAHIRAYESNKYDLFRRVLDGDGTTYCFLFADGGETRNKRIRMLEAICRIARGMLKKNSKVLGIATEKKICPECSYDFCFLHIPVWTKQNQIDVERLQKETSIFLNPIIAYAHDEEYPQPADK